jgi:opacity protein-like surface antigen
LLGGTFRPEVGAVASYTFRSYTDTQFALSSDSVSSQAFDVGFMTGVSLELSQSFSLGFDFRYMQNLSNKVDSQFQKSYVQPYLKSDKPVERLNYYTMGLVLRSTF